MEFFFLRYPAIMCMFSYIYLLILTSFSIFPTLYACLRSVPLWDSMRCDLFAGISFRVMRPPNYLMNLVLLLTLGLIAGLAYIKRDSLDFLFQTNTWACIVISFILVMMSGQMWNQIRGPGFAHRDPRTGEMVGKWKIIQLSTPHLCNNEHSWSVFSLANFSYDVRASPYYDTAHRNGFLCNQHIHRLSQ